MKCPEKDCNGKLVIELTIAKSFRCACDKCGKRFEAKVQTYGEEPKVIRPWPY
ncbi:MAG: hypothetical protein PHU56_03950 [Candidatus Pacebacteria bacterium]|nr:hypothetical protein [Candidatus Paceibacterota bacterium]